MRLLLVEPFLEDARALERALSAERSVQVVGVSEDVRRLGALIDVHHPDLVLLALSFLRQGSRRLELSRLTGHHRARLVFLTDEVESATPTARTEAARALVEGALDVVFRPPPPSHPASGFALRELVHRLGNLAARDEGRRPSRVNEAVVAPRARPEVVGVVASAGGPAALALLLAKPLEVPVLVAQHITPGFVGGFAQTLRKVTGGEVAIGEDRVLALPGHVYLAPDRMDLGLWPDGRLRIDRRNPRSPQPSGDALLEDLARWGPAAVAVVLTGMGEDGLLGARRVKASGGRVLIQSRESSLVFGMPGCVAAEGLADAEQSPEDLARTLHAWIGGAV